MSESWNNKEITCPIDMTFAFIGGKYKAKIVYFLMGQTLRYNEIQKNIPAATPRMLSRQLQELEQDGIIHRKLYPVVPPKTEYSLTDRGKTLSRIIVAMYEWGSSMFSEYGMVNPCRPENVSRMYRGATEYEETGNNLHSSQT